MITTLLSWVAMPVVRYLGIALIGLLFTAYMRADAARPYREKAERLEVAIAERDRIIADHEQRVEADRREAEELERAIGGIADAAKQTGACVLSRAELERLQQLTR